MTRVFLDIENKVTPHPRMEDLLLVGYAVDDGPVVVLDWALIADRDAHQISDGSDWAEFARLMADPKVTKVEHTKHDARTLMLAGVEVAGDIHDTANMAYVLNENTPLDIDWLAWRYAGIDMEKQLRRSAGKVYFHSRDERIAPIDLDEITGWYTEDVWLEFSEYNVRDVEALRKLYWKLWARLDEGDWLDYWLTEHVPYTGVLAHMETRGLPVDTEATVALAEELRPEMERVGAELLAEGGLPPSFNLNSGDQLAKYLFSRVVVFNDALVYDTWTIEVLKSCLDGDHEDCQVGGWACCDEELACTTCISHVVDWLPEGFTIDKLGRDRVHGHWTVKGRGLKPTPPTRNKVTGELGKRPSTASPELLYMHADDDWVRKLCTEYRKVETLLSTFLTRWPEQAHEGRLYGRFNQNGTVTGRLSSAGPNLQNVPARGTRGKQVRGLFVAAPGTSLVVGDYDQLEMRLMGHFSDDKQLLRIFREGRDPHSELARAIFGADIDPEEVPAGHATSYRDAAKTLNYAMGYGAGPKKVAQTLSLLGWPTTKDTAEGYLAEMARYYRGLFAWKNHVIKTAKRRGSVRTLGGHRRRLRAAFKDTANWKLVGYGERQAVNAIVQGSAADILRRAMVRVDATLPELRMLAQVHDELVFEATPETLEHTRALAELQRIAEVGHGFDLAVPLLFVPHSGHTWAAAKSGADIAELMEEVADDLD